jgi:hypothetical protein
MLFLKLRSQPKYQFPLPSYSSKYGSDKDDLIQQTIRDSVTKITVDAAVTSKEWKVRQMVRSALEEQSLVHGPPSPSRSF